MKLLAIHGTDKLVQLDDDVFDRISKYRYYFISSGSIRRVFSTGKWKNISNDVMGASRRILFDHIDRDIFNNQRSNLRPATMSQNAANIEKRGGCLSKYKGVSWHKQCQKWRAYIKHNYDYIHLGLFKSEKEAALAYNKEAVKRFGEFAVLNIL